MIVWGLGGMLGWFAGRVLRIRRTLVISAMTRAGIQDPKRHADAMYRSLGVSLVEFLLAAAGVPLDCCAAFEADAAERLRAHLGRQGAVVACAHTANWDLVAGHIARRWPLLVITKRLRVGALDRFWHSVRREWGVNLVAPGDAAGRAVRHLRQGGVVVAMADQAPERRRGAAHGTFFGRRVGLDLTPALLAMRARVPLAIAFPLRLAGGTYTIHVQDVLLPPRVPRREWAVMAMRSVAEALESFVSRDPSQWLWLHRRWKPWPPEPSALARARSDEEVSCSP